MSEAIKPRTKEVVMKILLIILFMITIVGCAITGSVKCPPNTVCIGGKADVIINKVKQ